MDNLREQEYQRQLMQLKQAYVHRLENTIRIIDNILDMEQYSLPTREDLLRAQALVHGLAGSGATFGFPEITDIGRDADHILDSMLKHLGQGQKISKQEDEKFDDVLKKVQNVCRASCGEAQKEMPVFANTNIYLTPGTKGHAHILIIDDDPHIASAIAGDLESLGMTIQMTGSGEDALHYLARVRPDMVILDIELKGMNGFEVLQQIKQNSDFFDIPVLVLTAHRNETDEKRALQAGALAYVHKPIDTRIFTQHIRQLVEDARQAQSM